MSLMLLLIVVGCAMEESRVVSPGKLEPMQQLWVEPTQVTAGNESNYSPVLSPNGQSVFFTTTGADNKDIWRQLVDGGERQAVTKHAADDFNPSLSPDGERLAFVSRRKDAAGDIHITEVEDSWFDRQTRSERSSQRIVSQLSEDREPSWFPGSDKIVFASRGTGATEPKLMVAHTKNLQPVPLGGDNTGGVNPDGVYGSQPSVSPDGTMVTFIYQGDIYIYNIVNKTTNRVTQTGSIPHGNPRFSPDGTGIYFISYRDDTNKDRRFDASDAATLWYTDLADLKTANQPYLFMPLTTAERTVYSPFVDSERLFFSMQVSDSLDIYSLPKAGQHAGYENLSELRAALADERSHERKVYLIRRSSWLAAKQNRRDDLFQLQLLGIREEIDHSDEIEAKALLETATEFWPGPATENSILQVLSLELQVEPLLFPGGPTELSVSHIRQLKAVRSQLVKVVKSLDSWNPERLSDSASASLTGNQTLEDLLTINGRLLHARIEASLGNVFKAVSILKSVGSLAPPTSFIRAKIDLYDARLSIATGGYQVAISKLIATVKSHTKFTSVAEEAARIAVHLTKEQDGLEGLAQLLSASQEVPTLAAITHIELADTYLTGGKEAVAANELRQIVDRYLQAPGLRITASNRLVELEEVAGRHEQAGQMLRKLYKSIPNGNHGAKSTAKQQYTSFRLRRAEYFMTEKKFSQAQKIYQELVTEFPDNLEAHRGSIDAGVANGEWEQLRTIYQKAYAANSRRLTQVYTYGYVETFLVDQAGDFRTRLAAIDRCIELFEDARRMDGRVLTVHQSLGWLYLQKSLWRERYEEEGLGRWSKRLRLVKNLFTGGEPDWLGQSINSFLTAYNLSKENSLKRAKLDQNLAEVYYQLGNFQKSLRYGLRRLKPIARYPFRHKKVEALYWMRAGRAAFQTDEWELSASLLKKAVSSWEQVGDLEQAARARDHLALTLSGLGRNEEASDIYQQLARWHLQQWDRPTQGDASQTDMQSPYAGVNVMTATTNEGIALYRDGQFDKAAAVLMRANELLVRVKHLIQISSDDDAIQISLGGGSSAGGFNPAKRQWLIEVFLALAYEGMGRNDLARIALEQQAQTLLEARRQAGVADHDESSLLAVELAHLHNKSGWLALKSGNSKKAALWFKSAAKWAKLDPRNGPAGQLINQLNFAKTVLRRTVLGLSEIEEQNSALAVLKDLTSKQSSAVQVSNDANKQSRSESLVLESQISPSQILPGQIEVYLVTAQLLSAMDQQTSYEPFLQTAVAALGQVSEASLQDQLLVAWLDMLDKPFPNAVSSRHIRMLRQRQLKKPDGGWRYLASRKQWLASYRSLEGYIRKGGYLDSAVDRLLAWRVFEKAFADRATGDPVAYSERLRQHTNLGLIDLYHRLVSKSKLASDTGVLRTVLINLDQTSNGDSAHPTRFLDEHERAIIVHQRSSNTFDSFCYKDRRLLVANSSRASLESLFSDLSEECFPTTDKATLYIVPTGNLFRHEFEQFQIGGKNLAELYPIAYLPSIDLLPSYRHFASVIAASSFVIPSTKVATSQPEDSTEVATQLTNDQTTAKMENLTSGGADLSGYDIFHVEPHLYLNSYVPGESILSHTLRRHTLRPKTPSNSWSIRSCFLWNLAGYQIASWSHGEPSDLAIEDGVNGADGWKLLGLLGLHMQVPTQLLGSRTIASSSWKSFYEQLATKPAAVAWQPYTLRGRLIGYGGVSTESRNEFARRHFDTLYEVAEDAYEEENWLEAGAAYRRVFHLANMLEDENAATEALDALVNVFYLKRDYRQSLRFKSKQVDIIEDEITELGDESDYDSFDLGEAVLDAAVLAVRAKVHDQAEKLLTRAERIFEKEDEIASLGKVFHYRGINLQNQGNYRKAIVAFERSRTLYKEENPIESARRTLDIGNAYRNNLSMFETSLQYYRLAADVFKAYEKSAEYIAASIDLTNTLITLGRMPEVIATLEKEIIPRIDQDEELNLWIRASQILGNAYFRIGSFQKAGQLTSEILQTVAGLEPEIKRVERTLDARNLEAMIAAKRGRYAEAFAIFSEAIATAKTYSLPSQVALFNANMGFWHREAGLVEESLIYFDKALTIDRRLKSESAIAFNERNIGLSLILTGQLSRARVILERSLSASERLNLVYNRIYCHFGLGELALRMDNPKVARKHFKLALESAKKSSLKEFIWRAYGALGDAAVHQNERSEAINYWQLAIDVIEMLPPGAQVADSTTGLKAERGVASIYDRLTETLMISGQPKVAWLTNQRALARIHLDSYASEMTRWKSTMAGRDSTEQQVGSAATADSLRRRRQYLRMERPYYEDLATIQKHLTSDTIFVSYAELPQGIAIWLTTAKKTVGFWQSIGKADFAELVADYRTLVENYSSLDYLGKSLSELLLSPGRAIMGEFTKVVINGSGLIDQVPFAALPFKEASLIDFHTVTYIDHSTDLIPTDYQLQQVPKGLHSHEQSQHQPWSEASVLGVAVPNVAGKSELPFAVKEVMSIDRFLPKTNLLIGAEANLETLRKLAPRYDILHLATHGGPSQAKGQPVEMLLGGSGQNQSSQDEGSNRTETLSAPSLGISEVFRWHLDADLVAMSACSSEVGDFTGYGINKTLSDAFRFAGAKDIIGTLWRISDVASAVVMKRFYRALGETDEPGGALRRAQLVTREYFQHPAYWAGFRYYQGN